MSKILIIEDDVSINRIISYELKKKDYEVVSLFDGQSAVDQIMSDQYDLVLVDWMLPDKDGLSIIKTVRENNYIKPLILLTAKSAQEDIIEGLSSGADDYLTKPFQSNVLIARIEAHLRRHHKHFKDVMKYGDIEIDIQKREVKVKQEIVKFTKVEYDLLKVFIEQPHASVSREMLLQTIWGFQYDGDTRIVDVHIHKLKSKLKESCVSFKSVRGVGYKLVKNDE